MFNLLKGTFVRNGKFYLIFISNKKLVKAEICHNVKFHLILQQKVKTKFNLIFSSKT